MFIIKLFFLVLLSGSIPFIALWLLGGLRRYARTFFDRYRLDD